MNRKIVYLLALASIVALVGISLANQPMEKNSVITKMTTFPSTAIETLYKLVLERALPSSLDPIYQGSIPERVGNAYLGEMFNMAGPLSAIAINVQQGDWTNAKTSFNAFSAEYNNVSKMVPEWRLISIRI